MKVIEKICSLQDLNKGNFGCSFSVSNVDQQPMKWKIIDFDVQQGGNINNAIFNESITRDFNSNLDVIIKKCNQEKFINFLQQAINEIDGGSGGLSLSDAIKTAFAHVQQYFIENEKAIGNIDLDGLLKDLDVYALTINKNIDILRAGIADTINLGSDQQVDVNQRRVFDSSNMNKTLQQEDEKKASDVKAKKVNVGSDSNIGISASQREKGPQNIQELEKDVEKYEDIYQNEKNTNHAKAYASSLFMLGKEYFKLEDYSKARETLEKAVEICKGNALDISKGRYEELLEVCENQISSAKKTSRP